MNSVVKPVLVPCLLLVLASNVTLSGKKPELIRVEQVKIHSTKGGGGWIEVLTVWGGLSAVSASSDFDAGDYDVLAEYGVKNRRTHSTKIDQQKMRVVSRGEFAEILQFVRILDSGVPFLLWHYKNFDIRWDGNLFKLRMKYEVKDVATTVHPKDSDPTFEITTDGRFTDRSTGQLSENRSKIIVDSAQNELLLEIEGLGQSSGLELE